MLKIPTRPITTTGGDGPSPLKQEIDAMCERVDYVVSVSTMMNKPHRNFDSDQEMWSYFHKHVMSRDGQLTALGYLVLKPNMGDIICVLNIDSEPRCILDPDMESVTGEGIGKWFVSKPLSLFAEHVAEFGYMPPTYHISSWVWKQNFSLPESVAEEEIAIISSRSPIVQMIMRCNRLNKNLI